MTMLTKALDAAGITQSVLASAIGVTPQAVHNWIRGRRVPASRCPAIEAETGVRCEQLRPDLIWTRNEAGEVTGYHVRIHH